MKKDRKRWGGYPANKRGGGGEVWGDRAQKPGGGGGKKKKKRKKNEQKEGGFVSFIILGGPERRKGGKSDGSHTTILREVFWHEYAKIPRHTSKIPLPQAIWNNFGYVTVNGVNSNKYYEICKQNNSCYFE